MRSAFRARLRPPRSLRRPPGAAPLAPVPLLWRAQGLERRCSTEAVARAQDFFNANQTYTQSPAPQSGEAADGNRKELSSGTEAVPRPTNLQLKRLWVNSAVPFVAFGIVDQTVLIWAGDAIDNTVGVFLGLPTLAAAAMGQVLSDTCGVTFGGTIEAVCLKLGLPLPGLTDEQQRLGITKRVSTFGGVCGVIVGCMLGMTNLLLIDMQASERAKKAKELETIMNTVMADGQVSLSCERATLWMVDEEAGELWSSVATGVDGILRVDYRTGSTIAGWVAVNREMANVPDVKKDPRWAGGAGQSDFVPQSMLCAPVIRDGKAVAVIQLLNKKEDGVLTSFTSNDEKVLHMLASHVSIFLEQLG